MTDTIKHTTQFKKDYKRVKKQGRDITMLVEVLEKFKKEESSEVRFNDHQILAQLSGFRECHLKLYWLLIFF